MDAKEQGIRNYNEGKEIPSYKLKKAKECAIKAPIDQLSVPDIYQETSGKVCKHCNCPLPYKLRQDIEPCECWESKS